MSAFFRIVGQSNSYFLQTDISPLRNLLNAQNITNLPSSGLYELKLNSPATTLNLRKSNEKGSHEAVWKVLRKYFDELKIRVLSYGQFSESQKKKIALEIDCLIEASKGIGSKENISTIRNDVQYRQKLDCWYPNLKVVKKFHLTDHIRQALSADYDVQHSLKSGTEYEEFFTKGLALCGFVHKIGIALGETSPAKSLSGLYVKYDRTLV